LPSGKSAPALAWCWVTFAEQSMVISRERRIRFVSNGAATGRRISMTAPPLDAIGYQIAVARQIGALTDANA